MPNISTITVSGTNYDVADSVARNIVNNTADYVVDKNSYVVGNTTNNGIYRVNIYAIGKV